ncbi:MAG: pyridoxal-phosphate dependent enzyme [Gemmatimonadetes bacterium]|nr:pyridoxal-phosphate dependent enzyme [Gemmatimonadota bacterium]
MKQSSVLPSAGDVRAAAARIAAHVVRTPLVRSETLSEYLGGDVWLKCECEQRTGSFKLRGATNALACLDPGIRARGVVASSAGNHGAGIAHAAHVLGVPCTVFVPAHAPAAKRDRIAAAGAVVDASAPHYDAAEALAIAHASRTGAAFVNPCIGRDLLAGQGTVALEIVEDLPQVRTIITNVGGGGLCGGMGGYLNDAAPGVALIGAQSAHTDVMARALAANAPADDPHMPTLCDGLAGLVDTTMLAQARESLTRIAVAREAAVAEAVAYLWREEGRRVEGAGAAGLAALLAGRAGEIEFPCAVVLSGGNIDEGVFERVLAGNYNSG